MKQTGKKSRKKWIVLSAVGAFILVIVGVLYQINTPSVFADGTKLNGIPVAGQSAEEAEKTLTQAAENYKLTVRFAQGTRIFFGKELGLNVKAGEVEHLLYTQKECNDNSRLEISSNSLFQCDDLTGKTAGMPERNACAEKFSQNAVLQYDNAESRFVIQPETIGGTISTQKLAEAIESTAVQLQPELDTVSIGLYSGVIVRRGDSPEMKDALKKANRMLDTNITLTFDVPRIDLHGEEPLDKAVLVNWLEIENDGKTVTVSEELLDNYVNELVRRYSVQDNNAVSQFVTTLGTHIEVDLPASDENVDAQALKTEIIDCVERGAQGIYQAPYCTTKSGEAGTTDLGGTYVEVDLDHQHLYLYAEGKKITEGNICSGCVADSCATPEGLYTIKSKDYDRYLVGPGYQNWVNYFMPFNGGIGLHDSTWRSENEYGGEVYLESGSHGCINMPLDLVKTVDQYVDVGDYVILYGGVPNPKPQPILGTSYYVKKPGDAAFQLDAYSVIGSELSYQSSSPAVADVNDSGMVTIGGTGTTEITVTAPAVDGYARGEKKVSIQVQNPQKKKTHKKHKRRKKKKR